MSSAASATPKSSAAVPRMRSSCIAVTVAAAVSLRATRSSAGMVTPEKVSVFEVEPSTFGVVLMVRPLALRGTRHSTVSWVFPTCPSPVMPALVAGIHALLGDKEGADGRDIGERSDAVLWTAMPGHDEL